MSRHRNVRSMNYEDECYDDDDDYSRSYEDNYCISPGTVAQFTWNRERNTNLASYMGADEVINEVDIEEDIDDVDSPLQDSFNVSQARSNLNDTDKARLNSCLEEIHNIMGETVPESIMVDAILRNQFSVEKSLNELLSQQDAPKPQRQPRNRNKSQDDSDDTNQLNQLLADIQTLESITKPEYHAHFLLRFKSNPGSDEADSCTEVQQCSMSSKDANTKDECFVLKVDGIKEKVPSTNKSFAQDASPSSLGPLQKGRNETSLSKPKVSLSELAKQSNSSPVMKEAHNNSKLGTRVILKGNLCSDNDKTFHSEKVSLADLSKQSNKTKVKTDSKCSKGSDVDSFVSDLSAALDKNLLVRSSRGTKSSDSVKLSLADLANQHKSNAEGSLDGNKIKLGDSSSAFVAQHLANKNIKSNQHRNKTSSSSLPTVSTLLGKRDPSVALKTPSSQTSLSELANQHKTNLLSSNRGLKKDKKIGQLSTLVESRKSPGPRTLGVSGFTQSVTTVKQISGVKSAEVSLAKLSLTSCLRSSKQNSGSLVSGKASVNPEYLNDFSHIVSSVGFKENKGFAPVSLVEKVDMSLVSLPSSSAFVFCNITSSSRRNSCGDKLSVKRKINYPCFACDNQVKKRRILYPQPKLHQISPFDFSSMSPDDIVKKKQKQAFMRSDKEFSVNNSCHS